MATNTTQQALDAALAECERLRNAYDAAHNQAMANGQARDRAIDECERLRAAADALQAMERVPMTPDDVWLTFLKMSDRHHL